MDGINTSSLWLRAGRLGPGGRTAASAVLLATAFAAREALEPVFGDSHSYTVFYSVVILAAYFLGPRCALGVTGVSAVIGYWFFDHPALAWKWDGASIASFLLFCATGGVATYFITCLRRALADLALERSRAEDLARSHASLFGELNERVTNHLQLVAALLQLQARDERDGPLSLALAEASARTLLISRVHRSLAGEEGQTLDFDAFARQLLDGALAARGDPRVRVDVEREGLRLPIDQAASVAMVLLECLNSRLRADTPAVLRVRLRGDDHHATLEVLDDCADSGGRPAPELKRHLIDAMVEQLGGRFSFRADVGGAVSRLEFPRLDPAAALVAMEGAGPRTVH